MESAEEEEAITGSELAKRILQRRIAMTAQQNRSQSETLAALPPPVRRRLRALKNLQLSVTNLEAEFYQEVHALEIKYMRLYYPSFNKRADIVTGRYEPEDAECQWESDEELAEGLEKAAITEKPDAEIKKMDENVKGIPEFWLTIFKNVSLLAEMMQEHDEPIIEHLEDIKVLLLEKDPMGFVLEFHFSPNEYFTNLVLTKEYHMKCQPEPDNPFDFEGPEIFKCIGCPINWCKDKNVTVKTIKKKQKHKSRGSVRTITKTVQNDSFFNFFNPPELPADPSADVAEELQNLLSTDFEIGHYLRERVVPHAVLLYTGEGLDEEDDFEEEEEESFDEEDDSSADD